MLRLNLGCGIATIPGYINIDNSPNIYLSKFPTLKKLLFSAGLLKKTHMVHFGPDITYMNLPSGLRRFSDNSVDRIYTSHFLEHLTFSAADKLFSECRRILVPGGIFRIVVPDCRLMAIKYVESVDKCIAQCSDSTEPRDTLVRGIAGGFVHKIRSGHCSAWDIPSLRKVLADTGFRNIEICSFQQGSDQEMAKRDSRPEDSIFIEAIK